MLRSLRHQSRIFTPVHKSIINAPSFRPLASKSSAYIDEFARSLSEPDVFWGKAADGITWYKRPTKILDSSKAPFYRWYADGDMNTCYNAVDRHVEAGHGDQVALITESPLAGTSSKLTYSELLDQVSRFAGVLSSHGVSKGDRVVIYMPMVAEAVVAMLACARLGAVHSVVFGGFAGKELAVRIDDAKPKVIVTASCGIEPSRLVPYKPLVDTAFSLSQHKPTACIVLQRKQHIAADLIEGRDYDYDQEMQKAKPHPCVPVKATDPLYVLYTSGTTGAPKGVLRDNGGHAVALKYSMSSIFDVKEGETFWAGSDIGWVVGHSYIVYGPLINRNTTVMYEGKPIGTPDAGSYWRIINKHKVNSMFTAPTALRAIKREDPEGAMIKKYDISSLRSLFVAGERCDPDTMKFFFDKLQIPIVDHWWQTETGWPMCATSLGLGLKKPKFGSSGFPVPGFNITILNETTHQKVTEPSREGAITVKLPLPPGTLVSLYNNDARFKKSYLDDFPGYFQTGDAGFFDKEGYLHIMARVDDVINVSGHRLSTGAIEEVLMKNKNVGECAVVGAVHSLKGQLPIGLVVLNKKGEVGDKGAIISELISDVRRDIGPVADFKNVVFVTQLPKTRSGKILRGIMRSIADNRPYTLPGTIENIESVEIVKKVLKGFKAN